MSSQKNGAFNYDSLKYFKLPCGHELTDKGTTMGISYDPYARQIFTEKSKLKRNFFTKD